MVHTNNLFTDWMDQLLNLPCLNHCVVPENIHTPPTEGFFDLNPPPLWNSGLGSYIPLKILAFKTPSPSEFPITLCGGGTDIFWNHTFNGLDRELDVCTYNWFTFFILRQQRGTATMLNGRRQFRERWSGKWMTMRTKVKWPVAFI